MPATYPSNDAVLRSLYAREVACVHAVHRVWRQATATTLICVCIALVLAARLGWFDAPAQSLYYAKFSPQAPAAPSLNPPPAAKLAAHTAASRIKAEPPVPAAQTAARGATVTAEANPQMVIKNSTVHLPDGRGKGLASAAAFGLKALHSGSVTRLNGATLNIGDAFPNGEVLLWVDPANGLVETSRRTLIVTD